MSFTTIRPALKTLLDAQSTLSFVYDYHRVDGEGFPYATFEPSDLASNAIDFSDQLREYNFTVVIHQEMENKGRDEAVRILAAAVDQVVGALEADPQLATTVDLLTVQPSSWGSYDKGKGSVLYASLEINCKLEVQVIT